VALITAQKASVSERGAVQEKGGVMAGGLKKRRKRSIEAHVDVDGFKLHWRLRSEPQWSTEDGYEGLSLSVQRADGAFRELVLMYPFPKKEKRVISGVEFLMPPGFPLRPKISPKLVEADIRLAIAGGWNPQSRGKPFFFQLPENSK
jgi:hypothetical protein